jgi:hypothetical protein
MEGARSACSVLGTGLLLVVMSSSAATAQTQTTAFTYQGQLTDAGAPANASYDLRFALFDTLAGGTQIGSTQTVPTVSASSGVFTVRLDFGVTAFPGANRFLEIGVKPAGVGSFTTLAPRQQISSTPYAIRTLSAASADALSSACVGCVQSSQIQSVAGSKVSGAIPLAGVPAGSTNYIQNTTTPQAGSNFNIGGNGVIAGNLTVAGTLNANLPGNFIQNTTTQQANTNFNISGNGSVGGTLSATKAGIGTTSPISKLHVVSGSSDLLPPRLQSSGTTTFDAGWDFYQGTTGKGYVGVPDSAASFGAGEMLLFGRAKTSLWAGGNRSVTLDTAGNVGIGIDTPTLGKLHVVGTGDHGVYGFSVVRAGIFGESQLFNGVSGLSHSGMSSGVYGTNDASGVLGSGTGVRGVSTNGAGVRGTSTSSDGVAGDSTSGSGVYGESAASQTLTSSGVYGKSTGSGGIGVIGEANVDNAVGVFGVSTSPTGFGMYGRNLSGGFAMYADGNTRQARDKGGWVKAMLVVNEDATIARCYNAMTGSSSVPCGFTIDPFLTGSYFINFGFQVNDRFAFVAASSSGSNHIGANIVYGGNDTMNRIVINTFYSDTRDLPDKTNASFTIIVF